MKKLIVSQFAEKKIKSGIQLLDGKDFNSLPDEEGLVNLVSQKGKQLGTAYLSRQNKGIGWVIANQSNQSLTKERFVQLFQKARQKRRNFEDSELTTAYRLFNQDGDQFGGVTIDRYNDYALFSWYNSYIYSQKDVIIQAFQEVFPDITAAYEKIRFKGLNFESAHLYGELVEEPFTVLENGVRYSVFLNDGLMTGIFLDQHEVRQLLVDGLAVGKSVLNLFSYTAAFSVAAAMGGAIETTSVDLAKRSVELSQAHFKENQIPIDQHKLIVMDTFEYFKYAKRHDLSYDLIVLDPPSFARNKKQTFSVAKDYHKLISGSVSVLNKNGIIIASTNASNLTVDQFKKQIEKGFDGVEHQYVELYRLPSDFAHNKSDESSNYLKVFVIRVKNK